MKISVIIPIYNCEKWLDACIQSVVTQAHVEEIILIDDGSIDASYEIASRWAFTEKKATLLSHVGRANCGRSATRNLGIQSAKEEWIAFLDADDTYLPSRFDHIQECEGIDGYYDSIKTEYVDEKLKESFNEALTGVRDKVNCNHLFDYLITNPESHFSLNGLVIKRSCVLDIDGFDESLELGEDTDLIWRLADRYCLRPSGRTQPVAIRRVHSENSFHNSHQLNESRHLFYKKWRHQRTTHSLSTAARRKLLKSYLAYHPKVLDKKSAILSRVFKLWVITLDYIGVKL